MLGMRYFDKKRNRLIFVQQEATSEYWDSYWRIDESIRGILTSLRRTWVSDVTQNYLSPTEGPVLEGGCGTAIHVAALANNGYDCIGVDFARETVMRLNQIVPELSIQSGDVRYLPFADSTFAGYWSLGVIEHFWEGYGSIADEMARVIKPGGYLFLTFPYMSPLRRFKSSLGLYPLWQQGRTPDLFYQFALDHQTVLQTFRQLGFRLEYHKPMLGLRAIQEDLGILNPLLQRLYRHKGESFAVRAAKVAASFASTLISGHLMFFVLKHHTDAV